MTTKKLMKSLSPEQNYAIIGNEQEENNSNESSNFNSSQDLKFEIHDFGL